MIPTKQKEDLPSFKKIGLSWFPDGFNLLIRGRSGTGKTTMAFHLMKELLLSGEPVIYVAMIHPPGEVRWLAKRFNLDFDELERTNKLILVDIASSRAGLIEDRRYRLSTTYTMSELASLLLDAKQEYGAKYVFIDAINSTYFLESSESQNVEEPLYKFLVFLSEMNFNTFIFSSPPVTLDTRVSMILETASHGIIDLEFEQNPEKNTWHRYLIVQKLRGQPIKRSIVPFEIRQGYIEFF